MRAGKKDFEGQITGGGLFENTTVNFDNSMTTAEIQALIDAQPRYIPNGKILTFQFADGSYTLDTLYFEGFYGGGTLYITGNQSESFSTRHTNQAVQLDFSGSDQSGILVHGCNMTYIYFQLMKITVDTSTTNRFGVLGLSNTNITIRGNYFVGTGTTKGYGASINSCTGRMQENYVSNVLYGFASSNAIVWSNDNEHTGTQPAYGLFARYGGAVGKSGTQPTGSTANEVTQSGGVIR